MSLIVFTTDMEAKPSEGLYTLNRCKTIHLVRHAQGVHNVEGEKNYDAYLSEDLFDAHLTPLGWQQVDNLRKHVKPSGISNRIELVVLSPLLRANTGKAITRSDLVERLNSLKVPHELSLHLEEFVRIKTGLQIIVQLAYSKMAYVLFRMRVQALLRGRLM